MKVTECSQRPILVPCDLENFEYQIDPYIGCEHFCRYCYVLNRAETDWTKEIQIYNDITSQLESELEDIEPQKIYLGYYTDPYQPCEKEQHQTRKVLSLLADKGFSASILTKSDLVTRDIDILSRMKDASISVSVAFSDNKIRQLFEVNTIDTEDRIKALRKIQKAGINTTALLCPVIPYITDVIPLVETLSSCTSLIWIYGLSILDKSDGNWKNVESILAKNFADISSKVEMAVFDKEHEYWKELRRELADIQTQKQYNLSIHL